MALGFSIKSVVQGAAFAGLNTFLQGIGGKGGYAKSNRFEIMIIPPSGVRGSGSADASNPFVAIFQKLSGGGGGGVKQAMFNCAGFSIPGKNLASSPDANLYGPEKEVVSGETFGDITSTFYCSSDLSEKRFFNTWQGLATASLDGGFSLGYYDDYVGRIEIYQLDERDERRYGCVLIDCFPKTVDDLAMTQDAVTSVQTLTVTWTYRYWQSLEDESGTPLGTRVFDSIRNTVTRRLTAQIPSVLRRL